MKDMARLQLLSDRQWNRRTDETVDERQARLQLMSDCQRNRVAAESVAERQAQLQQMCERLAAETTEREARLQRDRDRHREPASTLKAAFL